jgi:Dna[CI] antecedent, DciA
MAHGRQHPSTQALSRLQRFKQINPPKTPALGEEMIAFFKQSVEKRQTKLGKIAECWARLVPETLLGHCALESLHRGSLTVLVDSASHLYELKQLLLAGLQQQLLLACKSAGLRKITLKPGRWYDGADEVRKPRFG